MDVYQSWREHAQELQDALTPEKRRDVLAMWWESIHQKAHDYADMVAAHPKNELITEAEAKAMMTAYLCGYMASRGWVTEDDAIQEAFTIGRAFRDHLRSLGVTFDNVSPAVGVIINEVIENIVRMAAGTAKTES